MTLAYGGEWVGDRLLAFSGAGFAIFQINGDVIEPLGAYQSSERFGSEGGFMTPARFLDENTAWIRLLYPGEGGYQIVELGCDTTTLECVNLTDPSPARDTPPVGNESRPQP